MLTLPIKKKWFDMIKSGEKKEEYREIKPYYDSRFSKIFDSMFWEINTAKICFRNGYKSNSPKIICECKLSQRKGKPEFGAEPNKVYYVLKILSVEEVD